MTSIFVAKLDFGVTSDQLRQTFQQFGTVLKATVATDRETGKSRGFGFVEMADRNEAMTAIKELDGFLFNGRPIAVKEAEQRQDTRPPRDSNFQKGDFNRNRDNKPSGFQRNENQSGEYKRPSSYQRDEEPTGDFRKPVEREFTPPPAHLIDTSKPDIRKKSDKDKDKKLKDRDIDSRAKKTKMSAYKKSGKNNRFFNEDDEDDWDYNSADSFIDDEIDEDDSDNWNDEPSDYVDHSYEEEEDEEDED